MIAICNCRKTSDAIIDAFLKSFSYFALVLEVFFIGTIGILYTWTLLEAYTTEDPYSLCVLTVFMCLWIGVLFVVLAGDSGKIHDAFVKRASRRMKVVNLIASLGALLSTCPPMWLVVFFTIKEGNLNYWGYGILCFCYYCLFLLITFVFARDYEYNVLEKPRLCRINS